MQLSPLHTLSLFLTSIFRGQFSVSLHAQHHYGFYLTPDSAALGIPAKEKAMGGICDPSCCPAEQRASERVVIIFIYRRYDISTHRFPERLLCRAFIVCSLKTVQETDW